MLQTTRNSPIPELSVWAPLVLAILRIVSALLLIDQGLNTLLHFPQAVFWFQAAFISDQKEQEIMPIAMDMHYGRPVRHLEALLLVSDKEQTFLLSGQGDVIEPDGGIAAIGSGGPYAQAAAQALADHTQLSARQIAEEAMKIAGKMCIYTNDKVTIEEL